MSALDLLRIFREAVAAVEPCASVLRSVALERNMLRAGEFSCDLDAVRRITVVGAGKAAAGMAAGTERVLDGRIESGLVVVKEGYTGRRGSVALGIYGHSFCAVHLPAFRFPQSFRRRRAGDHPGKKRRYRRSLLSKADGGAGALTRHHSADEFLWPSW